jgi:hypothetical protein
MENTKFVAAIKACIAKIAAGGMALRVTRVDNPGALADGANSQSSRSLETLLELCIVQDGEGKPAIRLIEEKPYKVYTAFLTQTGTSAPVATVLENELGGTIVWTYGGNAGRYLATLSGAFVANKTAVIIPPNLETGKLAFAITDSANANAIEVFTSSAGVLANNLLEGQFIEIRIYR